MSSARAGWYVDPSTGTNLRFWSGTTWTDEVAPLPNEPMHSGPVDLFGAAAQAAESETTTAPVSATITAAAASGIDLVETEAERVETEAERVETEAERVETEAERVEAEPDLVGIQSEPAEMKQGPVEAVTEPAAVAAEPELAGDEPLAVALPIPDLEPEVEQTQLTRRELRARRGGAHPEPDDTPKHLPPMTPPVAVSIDVVPESADEVEIPAPEPFVPLGIGTDTDQDPVARRRRIIRLSVLLGILAVTVSVAALTAGTL